MARRKPPKRNGWWEFDEDGTGKQFVLVVGGCVASDDEWERSVGRPPDGTWCENYWEGNDVADMTNGRLTRGTWRYLGRVPDRFRELATA